MQQGFFDKHSILLQLRVKDIKWHIGLNNLQGLKSVVSLFVLIIKILDKL